MVVASWNVNSIKVRLPIVCEWLERVRPDVLCMQELKAVNEDFPTKAFAELGYQAAVNGQKTYNGVAILSRSELSEVGFGFEDESGARRFIEARVGDIRVVNVYVPNGQAVGTPKFEYKLRWLEQLSNYLRDTAKADQPLLLCGDFNVAPEDRDVYDPVKLSSQVLFHPLEREALGKITAWGLVDSYRLHHEEAGSYTWWDYRVFAFRRKMGLRIDQIWLTHPLADRCTDAWIDVEPRKLDKPSDHAPIGVELR